MSDLFRQEETILLLEQTLSVDHYYNVTTYTDTSVSIGQVYSADHWQRKRERKSQKQPNICL
jgi:hypothetical protein